MYVKDQLENGIRVVTEYRAETREISLGVLIDAGPGHDPLGKRGVAWLTQQMLLEGTAERSGLEIARLMDSSGGQVGASTTLDYILFYAHALDDYATYAIELLGDLLLNATFDAVSFERVKRAAIRRVAAIEEEPLLQARERLRELVWDDDPLGRPVHGTPEELEQITIEDVRTFFVEHYCPERTIVAAAGNVDHQQFTEQIEDALWRLDGTAPAMSRSRNVFHPGIVQEVADVSRAYFSLGLPAPRFAHHDQSAFELLNLLVGSGRSSRLPRQLCHEQRCADWLSSRLLSFGRGGLLIIEGATSVNSLNLVVQQVTESLEQLASGTSPISLEEFRILKMSCRGRQLLAAEHMETRMLQLALQQYYLGRVAPDHEFQRQLDQLDRERTQQVAADHLRPHPESLGLSVLVPDDCPERLLDELETTLDRAGSACDAPLAGVAVAGGAASGV